MEDDRPSRDRRSLFWSGAFLVVSRGSTLAAVPLLLHGLGAALYAAWVLAGTLVFSQGLVDLGLGAALVRFVALAGAERSRSSAAGVIWRAGVFYLVLSTVIGVPLWLMASQLAGVLPYLKSTQIQDGATLLRYAAAAFALTNLTLVAASALQGLDRVDASYRAQTVGWLAYLPLAIGLSTGGGIDAVGLAWLVAYGLQAALLVPAVVGTLRRLPTGKQRPPGLLTMLCVGGQWQVSAWADLATFQLPRMAGVRHTG